MIDIILESSWLGLKEFFGDPGVSTMVTLLTGLGALIVAWISVMKIKDQIAQSSKDNQKAICAAQGISSKEIDAIREDTMFNKEVELADRIIDHYCELASMADIFYVDILKKKFEGFDTFWPKISPIIKKVSFLTHACKSFPKTLEEEMSNHFNDRMLNVIKYEKSPSSKEVKLLVQENFDELKLFTIKMEDWYAELLQRPPNKSSKTLF